MVLGDDLWWWFMMMTLDDDLRILDDYLDDPRYIEDIYV